MEHHLKLVHLAVMNFLGHLYLSGDNPNIKLGNFIGDYVKGKQYQNYPPDVAKGILLHRKIDTFTDNHAMVRQSANRLKPIYGRYAGVVVDMLYDHLLAKNWHHYHPTPLHQFVTETHELLVRNYLLLPKRVKLFLPFLIASRRIETYATTSGIKTALDIMAKHTSLPHHSDFAIDCIKNQHTQFEQEFTIFINDIKQYIIPEL